ncbi:MAG: transporter [Jatrophihabitans sp.]|nr:transporter [Jatrophihabitans sp.]
MTALCLVQFVDVLGVTVVITALPSMLNDLGSSASSATPIVTGYAMFFGGLLMLGARLGDRYGHRTVLVAGLAVFALGSLVAAIAGSLFWLVVARCIQGAAAAGSVPSALRLLSAVTADEDERRRALAAWSASGAAAGACGLILGGVLTDIAGWRLLFWLNLPLAAGLVVAVLRAAPALPATRRKRLDLLGAAVLTVAVMGLVLGCALLEQSGRVGTGLALIGVGVVLSILFALVERRCAEPLLPGAAIRDRRLRVGAAVSALNTASTSSAITLVTLYLQDTRGASPAAAGFALLPFSLLVVLAAGVASARLMRRAGPRVAAAIGLGLIAVSDVGLLSSSTAVWLLVVSLGFGGVGLGLASVAATTIGTDVPEDLAATAAGVLNTTAQLGTALGVAVVVLIASSTADLAFGGAPLGWICAGALAAAGAAVLVMRRPVADEPVLASAH